MSLTLTINYDFTFCCAPDLCALLWLWWLWSLPLWWLFFCLCITAIYPNFTAPDGPTYVSWVNVSHLTRLKAHIKTPLLLSVKKLADKLHSNMMHVQVFCKDFMADFITDSVCETWLIVHGWVHKYLPHFLVFWWLFGCPEHSSSWRDVRLTLKCTYYSKTCVSPRVFTLSPKKHFEGLSSRPVQHHIKFNAGMLLKYVNHSNNRKVTKLHKQIERV